MYIIRLNISRLQVEVLSSSTIKTGADQKTGRPLLLNMTGDKSNEKPVQV